MPYFNVYHCLIWYSIKYSRLRPQSHCPGSLDSISHKLDRASLLSALLCCSRQWLTPHIAYVGRLALDWSTTSAKYDQSRREITKSGIYHCSMIVRLQQLILIEAKSQSNASHAPIQLQAFVKSLDQQPYPHFARHLRNDYPGTQGWARSALQYPKIWDCRDGHKQATQRQQESAIKE